MYVAWSGAAAPLDECLQHLRAGGLGQSGQLDQRVGGVGRAAFGPDPDQDNPFEAKLPILHLGDIGELGGQPGDPAQRIALGELEVAVGVGVGVAIVAVTVGEVEVVSIHSGVEINIVTRLASGSVVIHPFDRGTVACKPHVHYTRAARQRFAAGRVGAAGTTFRRRDSFPPSGRASAADRARSFRA